MTSTDLSSAAVGKPQFDRAGALLCAGHSGWFGVGLGAYVGTVSIGAISAVYLV
jgi:hypothetical protein